MRVLSENAGLEQLQRNLARIRMSWVELHAAPEPSSANLANDGAADLSQSFQQVSTQFRTAFTQLFFDQYVKSRESHCTCQRAAAEGAAMVPRREHIHELACCQEQ